MSKGKHIVVIDDDPDFVTYVKIVLTANGYEVSTAGNADEGLALIRQSSPDLVVLDMMMSYVLDGLTVSGQMQFDPALRHVPVLMVSAVVSDEHDSLFARPEGARIDAFMTKPVSPAALLSRIAELTGTADQ